MLERVVSKRYASAFFDSVKKRNLFDKIELEFADVVQIIEINTEFKHFLHHPAIGGDEKKQLLRKLFETKVENLLLDFLLLVADRKRLLYLKLIWESFYAQLMDYRNEVLAYVSTPFSLSAELRQNIVDKVSKIADKIVQIREIIEPSFIGGVYIRIGDKVIDITLKSELEKIKLKLSSAKVR